MTRGKRKGLWAFPSMGRDLWNSSHTAYNALESLPHCTMLGNPSHIAPNARLSHDSFRQTGLIALGI